MSKDFLPRRPGNTTNPVLHERAMARRILDRARKGEAVRDDLVDWAFTTTGDLPKINAAESAHCIQPTSEAYAGMDDMGRYAEAKREGEAA